MPYAFTLSTTIPATAQEIYDAWVDSVAHSEMTQAVASMSDEVGAAVSASNGYITGRNLEMVPGERIVQSWRTADFADEHEDSIITLTLEKVEGGTLLTLAHSNVPDGQTSYELGGWEEYYFEPMTEYFVDRARPEGAEEATQATSRTKRAVGRKKAKRAAPKPKATASSRKSAQRVAAQSQRNSAAKTRNTRAKSRSGK